MARAEPIEHLIADPQTDPQLVERLRTASQIRHYAVAALALPDNTTYTRYAALPGAYPLWNLFVTDELSLAAVPHCYPFFGCIAYKGYFDQARAEHTGNPVRSEVAAIGETPYPAPQPGEALSILITGGSQGAAVMTQVVPGALSSLSGLPSRHPLRVVQQCRPEDVDSARAQYEAAGIEAELAAFFDDLPVRLGAAQLVIARAGASTVTELTAAGRPAILVPLPTATDDHQSANARTVEAAGAGWVMVGVTKKSTFRRASANSRLLHWRQRCACR